MKRLCNKLKYFENNSDFFVSGSGLKRARTFNSWDNSGESNAWIISTINLLVSPKFGWERQFSCFLKFNLILDLKRHSLTCALERFRFVKFEWPIENVQRPLCDRILCPVHPDRLGSLLSLLVQVPKYGFPHQNHPIIILQHASDSIRIHNIIDHKQETAVKTLLSPPRKREENSYESNRYLVIYFRLQ